MLQKVCLLACMLGGMAMGTSPLLARAEPCARCGCECGCHAVCRPRCVTRTETEKVYGCECEDFCVPGEVRHEGCVSGCDGCDSCDGDCGCFSFFGVRIYTRKKLMVREVTREVPTTEWEVEYLCPHCAGCGGPTCDAAVCSGGGYSYPAETHPAPTHSGPPPPVIVEEDASAAAGSRPSIPHPQPRATLLETLMDRSR